MTRLSYDTALAVVYDPVAANRNATRAALYMLGFRHIETMATLEAFAEYLFKTPPDLAVCEVQGAEAQLCELIQSLRQGAGENPFLVVIVTAWENSNALVTRILNSGADDLLLRPFSVSQLGQRIRTHVERRKGFVITTDYIGPDRRRQDNDRASNTELYHPPNSLKMKSADGLSGEDAFVRLESELRTAREVFGSEKLRRDSFQICVLWRLLEGYAPGAPQYELDLAKITGLTKSVSSRCAGTDQAAAVQWCDEILDAIDGLGKGVERNATMHLLGKAAMRLGQVFDPNTPAPQRASQIDAIVAAVRGRQALEIAS
jgi:DNA-binding response OmpR family regulator